jgi:ABC-type transport system involved in multi-copper enzyme maturation permease subunit
MYKIWTIAWRELYVRFTDRNLLLIMVATPLAISTIVGLAFGGLGRGDIPIADIPVAVVNHDHTSRDGINYGQLYISLLVPGEDETSELNTPPCNLGQEQSSEDTDSSLTDLTNAVVFNAAMAETLVENLEIDEPEGIPGSEPYINQAARQAVDSGMFTAAIIIPSNYSETISAVSNPTNDIDKTGITVYANSGRPLGSGIILSIVEGITNQILTGNIAIAATLSELSSIADPSRMSQAAELDFTTAFACAFNPATNLIALKAQSVVTTTESNTASRVLVSVGSAQAMFFALFTAQFGVLSMYVERDNGTLQRLIVSPTPRSFILTGKLIGVFCSVLFQLVVLMGALTLVGSILQGTIIFIWGQDLLRVASVLISASLAVSGFGMFMAGIVKSPEQANVYGTVVNMAMAVLGGAFGFTLPRQISAFSLLYWGREAFDKLAANQGDIGLNILVLASQGVLMFVLGVILFNRRFEV